MLSIQLIDMNDRIDLRIHQFSVNATTNEFGYLWAMSAKTNSTRTDTALAVTYKLNSKLYGYFFINKVNYIPHIISIAVFLAFLLWLLLCRRKVIASNLQNTDVLGSVRYSLKNPFCAVLVIATVLIPYFYDHPPLVFVLTIQLMLMLAMGVLIKNNWPKALFNFWLLLLVLSIAFSISNLMTVITMTDRLVLVAIAIVAIIASLWLLRAVNKMPVLYPPYLALALRLFAAFNLISLILNITGRFSLAKILMAGGIFNLVLAMGLYLFVQIIMESLLLQFEVGKANISSGTFIDFEELQKKLKDIVIKVAAVLWLIALARNFVIDDYIYDQASQFLTDPHTFSATAFTFGSVLIFVIIIWVSGMVARVISYLYDFRGQQQSKLSPKEKKTRSSILLIRLAIFSIGLFIAINASGLPMDRITIVIGALGVGIGFGLQNIVNNLVSGVILAFEKPIQVGDVVDVGGKSGTIKEIGIRSSKIDCGDGSELIIPNGDLISQHVINWTLSNNNRRIELIVGVAYGSDVTVVEDLLRKIVTEQPDIMQNPAPAVHLVNFSEKSIDFRLWFWAAEIGKSSGLKSNVIARIYTDFKAAGIEIPHP